MKIAQIVCTFPPYRGGIGNSAFNFGEILNSKFSITNFTPNYRGEKKYEEKKYGKIIRLKPWLKYGNAALMPQLFCYLKKYDLIYLHYPFFGGAEIVWLFKIFFKKPKLIIHFHHDVTSLGLIAKIFSLGGKIIEKSLFKQADLVTCASLDYLKNSHLQKIYQKHPNKFKEIPFGVDTEKFKPTKKASSGKLRILFVGGLDRAHYFKGVNILLEAIAKLKNKNWELKIIGEGELKEKYKIKAKKLKIYDRVFFLGGIDSSKLIKHYQQADLFVLPSINKAEAFGIVLIEAMACGTPVIASDIPGVRSVFTDGQEGLRVEPNNTHDLKEKITYILNNSELRKKMSVRARELALKKYQKEKIKNQLINILGNMR